MARISSRLGTSLSGILLIGSWIFQEHLGAQSAMKEQDINRIEMALDIQKLRASIVSMQSTADETLLKVYEVDKRLKLEEDTSKQLEYSSNLDAVEYRELLREGTFIAEKTYATIYVSSVRANAIRRQSFAEHDVKILAMQSNAIENSEAMKYVAMQDQFIEDSATWLREVDSVEYPNSELFLPILTKVEEALNDHLEATLDQFEKVIDEQNKLQETLEADKNRTKGLASIFQILAGIAFVTGSILGITAQLKSERAGSPASHREVSSQNPKPPEKTAP